MATKIQIRGDSASNWLLWNPVLADKELAIEKDTKKIKIGDGVSDWTSLPYLTISTDADNITTGKLSNSRLSSDVTLMTNTFNGINQLTKLDENGKLPAIDGSALTNLSKSQVGLGNVSNTDTTNATNISSGTLSNEILSSSVTLQGNIFNGASNLVKLDVNSKLPSVDGTSVLLPSRSSQGTFIQVSNTSTQSIPNGGVATKVTFPTESLDNLNDFANSRFTSLSSQKVLVLCNLTWATAASSNKNYTVYIYKNGVAVYSTVMTNNSGVGCSSDITQIVSVTTNDYIEIYVSQTDSAAKNLTGNQKLSICQVF